MQRDAKSSSHSWLKFIIGVVVGVVLAFVVSPTWLPAIQKLTEQFQSLNSSSLVVKQFLQQIVGEEVSEVNGVAMVKATRTVKKFVTLEETLQTSEFDYSTKYLISSTKHVKISGEVRVVAGYHIDVGTSLRQEGDRWIARFSKPGILAVEPDFTKIKITHEQGWINKIGLEDYQSAFSHWMHESKQFAQREEILLKAEFGLRSIIASYVGCPVENVVIEELPAPTSLP